MVDSLTREVASGPTRSSGLARLEGVYAWEE